MNKNGWRRLGTVGDGEGTGDGGGRWGDGDGDGRGGDAIRIDIFTVSVTDRLGVIFS